MQIIVLVLVQFSIAFCSSNSYCSIPCDYGKIVPHTVCNRQTNKCGPDPKCGPDFKIIPLTNDQRQMILNTHNALRCRVGLGKETRTKQPSASNMRIMSYDRELEFIAQCWANACNGAALTHDGCRRTKKFDHVGQNLGYVNSTANNIDFNMAMKLLMKYWYDEVAIFNSSWVLDTRDRGPKYKVGHYTQMLWAETHRVGCAAAFYTVQKSSWKSYEFLFVCNYAPGGNYIGLPVYKPGVPGSACPDKQKSRNKCGMCGTFVNASKDDNYKALYKFV